MLACPHHISCNNPFQNCVHVTLRSLASHSDPPLCHGDQINTNKADLTCTSLASIPHYCRTSTQHRQDNRNTKRLLQSCSLKGWNTYGLQANPKVDPAFVFFDQAHVKLQAQPSAAKSASTSPGNSTATERTSKSGSATQTRCEQTKISKTPAPACTLVDCATAQQAIEKYRQYVVQVVAETGGSLSIYPGMEDLYIGNAAAQTGVSDVQRETMAAHWIGAAANVILGGDLTHVDAAGKALICRLCGFGCGGLHTEVFRAAS